MIKYFHYFMLGIAATALLSCADEIAPVEEIVPGDETPEVVSDKVPMVFSAALEETDTRSITPCRRMRSRSGASGMEMRGSGDECAV